MLRNPFREFSWDLLGECGKKSDNVALARWLSKYHAGRIVARFSAGAQDPLCDSTEGLWRCKQDYLSTARVEERFYTPETSRFVTPRTSPEPGDADSGPGLSKPGDSSFDLEMAGLDAGLEELLPRGWEDDEEHPSYASLVNERIEQRQLAIYKAELKSQRAVRAGTKEQLEKSQPQTPLVRVRPLAKCEKPPPGRDPIGPKQKDLPALPEVWLYGISSMFKDRFSPEMERLTEAYVHDYIPPPSPGPCATEINEAKLPKGMIHSTHGRIGPILRTYACGSENDELGDPGNVSEGEDEWIPEPKRPGLLIDEGLVDGCPGGMTRRPASKKLAERIQKRGREAEAKGRDPKRLKLLGPPRRVTFDLPATGKESAGVLPLKGSEAARHSESTQPTASIDGSGGKSDREPQRKDSESRNASSFTDTMEVEVNRPLAVDTDSGSWDSMHEPRASEESALEDQEEHGESVQGPFELVIGSFFGEGEPDTEKVLSDREDVKMGNAPEFWQVSPQTGDSHREGYRRTGQQPDAATGQRLRRTVDGQNSITETLGMGDAPRHHTAPEIAAWAPSPAESLEPGIEMIGYREEECRSCEEHDAPTDAGSGPEQGAEPDSSGLDESSGLPWPPQPGQGGPEDPQRRTTHDTGALIREPLPRLLEREKAIAARARAEGSKRPGFYLKPHDYPPLRSPPFLRPSEFSLRLREERARQRERRGPLAAARDEHGRRI